ncbi:hypothetical protein [Haloactinopolyspora alba]|uniref:hypothetical protein n=1 Tax=Haloactinopolyspora alba TaxID=648780 RepID=UPI00101C20EC|nr:hypothetical protein [Haloactinopolyspora alba]
MNSECVQDQRFVDLPDQPFATRPYGHMQLRSSFPTRQGVDKRLSRGITFVNMKSKPPEISRRTALTGLASTAAMAGLSSAARAAEPDEGSGASAAPDGSTPPSALDRRTDDITIENLGPAVLDFHVMSGTLVGETFYIGSRNLSPTRVAAFHVPTRTVTTTYMLGNGNFVQALAAHGTDVLYAGVTHAADTVNLYRIELTTGEVTGIASVPGLYIRDLSVAPDGVVYIVGRPRPHADGPPLYSYDPATGELTKLGIPAPDADQGSAVAATDTTVYFGCGSMLTAGTPTRVFAIDRGTGETTDITPPEIADDLQVATSGLELFDDILVLGTHAREAEGLPGHVAILDLPDGEWRVVPDYEGLVLRAFARRDNEVIVSSEYGRLDVIDLDTLAVRQLDTSNDQVGKAWGFGLLGDLLLGEMGSNVWTYDLKTGDGEVYDLAEVGAEGGPMLGMSIAVDTSRPEHEKIYVAATGWVARHDRSTGAVTKYHVPGEPKDMVVVGDTLYMGVYNNQGIWEYRPGQGPRQVAQLPEGQNRPQAIRWDDVNELVVVGVKSDPGGGSICFYDPDTQSVTAHVNPLGDRQPLRTVATGDGITYIGGSRGEVAAWDPVAGRESWRMTLPWRETSAGKIPKVTSLVVFGWKLFGTTERHFFVVDLRNRRGPELLYQTNLSAFTGSRTAEQPQLLIDRGIIYTVSARSVVRINPHDHSLELLIDDLGAEWYGRPRAAFGDDHGIFTLSGRDLVRIRDWAPRITRSNRNGT